MCTSGPMNARCSCDSGWTACCDECRGRDLKHAGIIQRLKVMADLDLTQSHDRETESSGSHSEGRKWTFVSVLFRPCVRRERRAAPPQRRGVDSRV